MTKYYLDNVEVSQEEARKLVPISITEEVVLLREYTEEEKKQQRIAEIKPRLSQLSQDLIQAQAGAVFENLEEIKTEFQTLHNELRVLEGKEPRKYFS
jgi:sugar diacid utilization regulator